MIIHTLMLQNNTITKMSSDKILFKFMTKIFGLDLLLMMEDTVYILKRQSHPDMYKAQVEQLRTKYKNSLIMGGSFGLALLFSLRRYFPSTFGTFSLNRTLIELVVLGGTLIGSTLSVVMGGAKVVHGLKKTYIVEADPDVYGYMGQINDKYGLDEVSQARFVLSKIEFSEWEKYRQQTVQDDKLAL